MTLPLFGGWPASPVSVLLELLHRPTCCTSKHPCALRLAGLPFAGKRLLRLLACRQHPTSAAAATLPQEARVRIERALDTAGIKMWELSNVRAGRAEDMFRVTPGCRVECFPECWPAHPVPGFRSPWRRWITADVWAPRWIRPSWPWLDGHPPHGMTAFQSAGFWSLSSPLSLHCISTP